MFLRSRKKQQQQQQQQQLEGGNSDVITGDVPSSSLQQQQQQGIGAASSLSKENIDGVGVGSVHMSSSGMEYAQANAEMNAYEERILSLRASVAETSSGENTRPTWRHRIKHLPGTVILLVVFAVTLVALFLYFFFGEIGQDVTSAGQTVVCPTDIPASECNKRVTEAVLENVQVSITQDHLFTTFGVFAITSFSFFVIRAMRVRRRGQYLQSLPKSSIQIWNDLYESSDSDTSYLLSMDNGRVAEYVKLLMETSLRIRHFLKTNEPRACGDPNWGTRKQDLNPNDPLSNSINGNIDFSGTHFPTTIALSYVHLEEAAVGVSPQLKIRPRQSISEYVDFLKRELPELDAMLLDRWLRYYEEAKFSNADFDQARYIHFMDEFFELLMCFSRIKRPLNYVVSSSSS